MKEIDILSLARENIRSLKPYSSARDDFNGSASVFLDANENPFPNSFNRYPDPHQKILKEAITKIKNISVYQLFLGNGSDEAIDLLFRVFCEPGRDSVIIPQPTYGMYSVSAAINHVKIISITLTPAFELDALSVLGTVTAQTKMIFLCSPNNPSGNLLKEAEIEYLLNKFSGLVVVDEAYIDFTESKSWSTRLQEFQNLVILQTFSKAWGLAGLRLGMCLAHPEIIKLLNKVKPPYNINAFTQSEALKAITSDGAQKAQWVAAIRKERDNLRKSLSSVPSVKRIYPSEANFLLAEVADAGNLYGQLVTKGIIVRDRSKVILCNNCLRITVGTPEENSLLIQAMRAL